LGEREVKGVDAPDGTVEAAEDRVLLPAVADERVLALEVSIRGQAGEPRG
jgi:hypothetical protein